MRKLLMIALLWAGAPALSMAAAAPGSFEGLAQAARASAIDAPAVVLQRPAAVNTVSLSNYSLAASSRDAHTGGLKTQALSQSAASPRLATPVSFSEGTAVNTIVQPATGVTPEVDASVSPPIPEPQSYALMIAGLVALGFMAARRGRG